MSIGIRSFVIICFCIAFIFSCRSKKNINPILLRVTSLVEEYPDSALSVLKTIATPEKMPNADYALYALLMAAALDKSNQSLLPCDLPLNFAIDYYQNNQMEKAMVLLYKGRLEEEMINIKEAIDYYQKASNLLQNHPQEDKLRMLIYSSLGNSYFNAGLYEESVKIFKELYEHCITDKDKASILNHISLYYCEKGQKDSTLITQHTALDYAFASGDSSLIVSCKYNLSLYFDEFNEPDSAIYYARSILQELPSNSVDEGIYYYNMGSLLLAEGKQDSANYYLIKSLENIPLQGKSISYKTLYNLEREQGNFKKAFDYLENYMIIEDSLDNTEQISEIQRLIYSHNTAIKVRDEQLKGKRILGNFIVGFIIVCFFIVFIYQNRINRRKRINLRYQQSLEQAHQKLSTLQTTIEDNQSMIAFFRQEYKDLEQERSNKEAKIKEREQIIEQLKEEKLRLRSWLFTQSDIYKKVVNLSKQKVSDKKQMKVLTSDEQRKLQETIFEIYSDHISSLKENYPKLTESDLLYLCLQQTPFDSLSIAICFGYSNTHPINQRKLRIKDKMKD